MPGDGWLIEFEVGMKFEVGDEVAKVPWGASSLDRNPVPKGVVVDLHPAAHSNVKVKWAEIARFGEDETEVNETDEWVNSDDLGRVVPAAKWQAGPHKNEPCSHVPIVESPSLPPNSAVTGDGTVFETSSTGGVKGVKPARFDQIPTAALRALAERFGAGNTKYPTVPGELDNWRKGYEWSKSFRALMSHAVAFWDGEEFDPDYVTEEDVHDLADALESGDHEKAVEVLKRRGGHALHMAAVQWHASVLTEWSLTPRMRELFDDRQNARARKGAAL